MITIHYFASIREALECESETMELASHISTVEQLIDHLIDLHGELWEKTLKDASVLIAVNQTILQKSASITPTDEIAFFPPVTGG